jgi:DNA-directed RNA polymerase specialized sigma24 family protein
VTADYPEATLGDAALIQAARTGSAAAYSELRDRHLVAVQRLARHLGSSPSALDDAVSEAFGRVLQVLQAGGGPGEALRCYLLRTLRSNLSDGDRPGGEPELSVLGQAFYRLPERWQTVLWHAAVEEEPAEDVALILGTVPDAVTSLVYRAREGLRQVYLDCSLDGARVYGECVQWSSRLAAHARGGLPARDADRLDEHLAGCRACADLYAGVCAVDGPLPALLGPVVLGPLTGKYLARRRAQPVAAVPIVVAAARRRVFTVAAVVAMATVAGGSYFVLSGSSGLGSVLDGPTVGPVTTQRPPAPPSQAPVTADTGGTGSPTSTSRRPTSTPTPSEKPPKKPSGTPSRRPGPSKRPTSSRPPTPTTTTKPPTTKPPPPAAVGLSFRTEQQFAETVIRFTISNDTGATGPAAIRLAAPAGTEFVPTSDGCDMTRTTGDAIWLDCGSMPAGSSLSGAVSVWPAGGECAQSGTVQARGTVGSTAKATTQRFRITCA